MQDKELYTADEISFFKSLENEIENGKYQPLETSKLNEKKKLFRHIANNTLEKITAKKSYSIRLFENDIESIKAIALQKGLPYQSLISSIIHQVATRQIKI